MRMRLVVLLSLVLVAASLPASPALAASAPAAPPVASASAVRSAVTSEATQTPTSIRITMGPSTVDYGGKSTMKATLLDDQSHPIPNRRVLLMRSIDGSNWTTVTSMFSTTGSYQTDVTAIERMCYRVFFRGDETHFGSLSPTAVVHSRAYLTAPSGPTRVYKGKVLPVTGYLKPKHVAGQSWVTLQADQWVNGAWKRIKTFPSATADNYSYSKYSAGILLPYTGQWRVRAFHSDAGHVPTYSGWTYASVVPDPTIRLSGTGGLKTPWFKVTKGTHRVEWSSSHPEDGLIHLFSAIVMLPQAPPPAPPSRGPYLSGSSGSTSVTFATNTSIWINVNTDSATSWSIVIR